MNKVNSSQPSINAIYIAAGSSWAKLATSHRTRNQKKSMENWYLLVISLGTVDPPYDSPKFALTWLAGFFVNIFFISLCLGWTGIDFFVRG
jgi:hypothetical protein